MAKALMSILLFLLVAQTVLSIAAFWMPWAIPVALVTTSFLFIGAWSVIGVLGAQLEKAGWL